jgi:hypothetical protein
VFIGILGFAAVAVTYRLTPDTTKREKYCWLVICFGLMSGEIWMMSKDRAAHDLAEQVSREKLTKMYDNVGLLVTIQTVHLPAIERQLKVATERHNPDPRQIADLQSQLEDAKRQADIASKNVLGPMAFRVVGQLREAGLNWSARDDVATSSHPSEPTKVHEELNRQEWEQVYGTVQTANYLREQLLAKIPDAERTQEDRNGEELFKNFLQDERKANYVNLLAIAGHLRNLAWRVAPPD